MKKKTCITISYLYNVLDIKYFVDHSSKFCLNLLLYYTSDHNNNQTDNSEVKNYVHNNLNTNPATKPTTSIPEERKYS